MEELTRLTSSRRAHKSHLTKLRTKIDEISTKEEHTETDVMLLGSYIQQLKAKQTTFNDLNGKIATLIEDPDELEREIVDSEDLSSEIIEKLCLTEQIFLNIKMKVNVGMSTHTPSPQASTQQNEPSTSSRISQESHQNNDDQLVYNSPGSGNIDNLQASQQENILPEPVSTSICNVFQGSRLPKLALPMFNGNALDWPSFWDSYRSAVHENPSLSDVQKFNYLRAQLSNGTERVIAGLPLTNANYTKAIQLLIERFGQPHKIVNAHMEALLNLPTPSNRLISLRSFYDGIENHVRGLEALGKSTETYGDILVPIIHRKLPTEVKRNLARQNGNKEWQLDELRNAILNEVEILEAGQCSPHEFDLNGKLPTTNATAAFFTNSTSTVPRMFSNRSSKRECIFCKGQHYPTECTVITDKEKRHAIVRDAKACFNCLNHHQVSQCKSRNRCKNCQRKHHTSLCQNTEPNSNGSDNKKSVAPSSNNVNSTLVIENTVSSLHSGSNNTPILLKTAVACIESDTTSITANILFDEGSQRSFITQSVANELNLQSEAQENITLSTFGGSTTPDKRVDTTTVHLKSLQGENVPMRTIIVPTIATPVITHNDNNISNLPHLKGLTLAHPNVDDYSNDFTVDVLVGADHYWDIVEDEVIKGPGPTAAKSKIGYLLSGPLPTHDSSPTDAKASILHTDAKLNSDFDLERFWNLDAVGVQPSSDDETSDFLQYYQDSSIILEDGHYSAKLPWRSNHPPLPSNEEVTRQRTRNMVRRLSTSPFKLNMYNDIITDQERRGFIERVEDPATVNGPCHYIPHHAVHKDSATTPIRIVYDCSFKHGTNPSLNDCLQPGPPLLKDMTGILLRFRLHQYGMTTDIEKAFLHVNLDKDDRDATRFFWLANPEDPESELVVYRFKSVMFGATSSPFILNATLHKHLSQFDDQFSYDMQRNLYVDDLVTGADDEETATTYYQYARNKMSSVGFNLRSWSSNCPSVQTLADQDNVYDTTTSKKILGMIWDINADKLRFPNRQLPVLQLITKREVLQETAKIFDPLGFLQPVTVSAKILLQTLWQEKLDWDEPLPPPLQEKWCNIATEIDAATNLSLPRRYFTSIDNTRNTDTELHVFADASQRAYGAVAYIVRGNQSSFVLAKTRVAPANKELTLPQLELMAALTAARLASYLQKQLQISNTTFWSDSQIVLHWLLSTKPLKQFINNRVKEIKTLTSTKDWKYCPTSDNPADLLTRGVSASHLESSLWQHGPPWLFNKSQWPSWSTNFNIDILHLQVEESLPSESSANAASPSTAIQPGLHHIINLSNYSTLSKLLRITALVTRFIKRLRKQETPSGPITTTELDDSKTSWVKNRQQNAFPDEIYNLQSKSRHRTTLVRQLRLYLDKDGLLRCGGRIHNAPIPENAKFPILIPSKDHLTNLLIHATHVKQMHAGVASTLTAIRQNYWIPCGRQRVKRHIDCCITCRRASGQAYSAPDPPPLPKSRLQQTHPFDVTGVDYTGALYVRESNIERKVYVCLFTCATTRAVHLEIVEDLTVESFLLAFRRFASRKSLPNKMISDNASTFMCADSEIQELFQSPTLKEALAQQGVDWQFIPKRAPWYGGFWERLIGLTKSTIKKVLGRASVNLSTLQTIIVEVEAVLNDRPLTYVSSDINDAEALTPAHLLYGRRITTLPHESVDEDEISDPSYAPSQATDVLKRSKRVALLIQHFWTRWRQEYLTSLREFHRQSGTNTEKIKVGDVVLIHDDSPRINWKLAVVETVNRGADGLIRSANVRTVNGTTNRPITRLHPLEMKTEVTDTPETSATPLDPPQAPRRSQRQAARMASKRITEQAKDI